MGVRNVAMLDIKSGYFGKNLGGCMDIRIVCSFILEKNMFFKRLTQTLIVFIISMSMAQAETIFEENFDLLPDWKVAGTWRECDFTNSYDCPVDDVPGEWDFYRSQEQWHPDFGEPANVPHMQINGTEKRGTAGKSFINSLESEKESHYTNYYNDGILMKLFDEPQDEVYVSFWIKMDPNWQWRNGSGTFKLFRVGHWIPYDQYKIDGKPVNAFNLGGEGNTAPMYLFNIKKSDEWGWQHSHAPRCAPAEKHYNCDQNGKYKEYNYSARYEGYPTYEDHMGDGQWHHLKFHVKMNSAPGAEDGIVELWFDDVLEYSVSNVEYLSPTAEAGTKWNFFSIGGNWNVWFAPVEDKKEQWYAIDDIVVSTTPIGETVKPLPLPPGGLTAELN